jgi:hypothetical protein
MGLSILIELNAAHFQVKRPGDRADGKVLG